MVKLWISIYTFLAMESSYYPWEKIEARNKTSICDTWIIYKPMIAQSSTAKGEPSYTYRIFDFICTKIVPFIATVNS